MLYSLDRVAGVPSFVRGRLLRLVVRISRPVPYCTVLYVLVPRVSPSYRIFPRRSSARLLSGFKTQMSASIAPLFRPPRPRPADLIIIDDPSPTPTPRHLPPPPIPRGRSAKDIDARPGLGFRVRVGQGGPETEVGEVYLRSRVRRGEERGRRGGLLHGRGVGRGAGRVRVGVRVGVGVDVLIGGAGAGPGRPGRDGTRGELFTLPGQVDRFVLFLGSGRRVDLVRKRAEVGER